ncbi:MAG: NADH-quinone oxidoreductase subunit J [Gemmataceae bacterium]|nr:NADH-quinone oxidoreductase subunit J [Gemmataceae bacterium]
MTPFAAAPDPSAAGQLALGVVLAAAGFVLLLPKPRGRSVAGGTAALLVAAVVLGLWSHRSFGDPGADWVEKGLFILFSTGAVGFGAVLVAQRNPARGAIAFAFVVLSTCGLFLLLAAPFLMAATVIIYAGAIIVTFLFVLMLSQAAGPSDENDRTREPLLGSLAGFAFAGLVLFALQHNHAGAAPLPAATLTADEKAKLADVAARLEPLAADDFYRPDVPKQGRVAQLNAIEQEVGPTLEKVVGDSPGRLEGYAAAGSIRERLGAYRTDTQARTVLARAAAVRDAAYPALRAVETAVTEPGRGDPEGAKAGIRRLRDEVRLLSGSGELPARNVGNLGLVVYADYLLAVELAGTLLLVATVGAVAIAHRRPATA